MFTLDDRTRELVRTPSQACHEQAVADRCRFIVDRRLTLGETEGQAIGELENVIAGKPGRASVEVTQYEATY